MLKGLLNILELIKQFILKHFKLNESMIEVCTCEDCYKNEIEKIIAEQIDPMQPWRTVQVVNGRINFRVANATNDISKNIQNVIMNNIFSTIQTVFPTNKIFFTRVSNKNAAQIKIFFTHNWDTSTPPPIPFKDSSLAYAFPPYNWQYSWHIYVNDAHDFWLNEDNGKYEIRKVMTHECLHALNLGHSDNPDDIMYRKYQRNKDINITQETKDLLLSMYAKWL